MDTLNWSERRALCDDVTNRIIERELADLDAPIGTGADPAATCAALQVELDEIRFAPHSGIAHRYRMTGTDPTYLAADLRGDE